MHIPWTCAQIIAEPNLLLFTTYLYQPLTGSINFYNYVRAFHTQILQIIQLPSQASNDPNAYTTQYNSLMVELEWLFSEALKFSASKDWHYFMIFIGLVLATIWCLIEDTAIFKNISWQVSFSMIATQ